MSDGMVKQFKKVGSHFAFEFFLEVWKDKLVEMFREWLSPITVEDVQKMVKRGKFPDTQDLDFSGVKDYTEYVEKISTERLFEDYLAPARPDLSQAIQEMGMTGAQWLVKLRGHLLSQVKSEAKPDNEATASPVKGDIVEASCDACGKKWPVLRSEFNSIEECPFCHAGKDEPSP